MSAVKVTLWPGPGKPEAAAIEAQLKKEGYSTYTWSDPAGTRYGDHEHPHTETRWVISGRIKIGSKSKIYDLGPGDRLDMPARTGHWAEVGELGPVTYVCGDK